MQTRSKGHRNLIRYIDNINRISRTQSKDRERIIDNHIDLPDTQAPRMEDPDVQNVQNNPNPQNQQPPPQQHHAPPPPPPQRQHLDAPIAAINPRRPIGAGDAPNIHNHTLGINPPAIQRHDFEIKGNILQMVQNKKYHGLSLENPIDHLHEFERLCSLTKSNGVSEDAFKLRLFPFSLGDKASQWEKSLAPGTINTWAECKKEFLAKFFSSTRTAKLRTQISSFVQTNNESFSEAWERFKRYQSECPHHGFSDETLLSAFYRGVSPRDRQMLDVASRGSFLSTDVDEGWELIDNLATSNANFGEDLDRTSRSTSEPHPAHSRDIKSLNEKLDKLLAQTQKQAHMVCEASMVSEEDTEQIEEVCYMQNNGPYKPNQQGFNNFRPNNNLSYRNPNVENPQDQTYPNQNQPQKQYQQRPFVPRPQYNNSYRQPFQPQPQAQQHAPPTPDVTNMLQQLLQGQTAHATELSTIRVELNKKIDASNAELNTKFEQLNSRLKYIESQHASTSTVTSTGQLPGKAVQNPREYNVSAINVTQSITEDSNFAEGEASLKAETEIEAEDFRGSLHEELTLDVNPRHSGCRGQEGMADNSPRLLLDEFTRHSGCRGENSESQYTGTPAPISSMLEKLDDPGSFTLPCSVGKRVFKHCVCDLGASVSLMPLSVARRLGFSVYEECDFTLTLGDRTQRKPYGLLEDVPVRVENVLIPTDFIILDMKTEPEEQLLLGRPFLASVGAIIDMKHGTITLSLGECHTEVYGRDGSRPDTCPLNEKVEDGVITDPLLAEEGTHSVSKEMGETPEHVLGPDIFLKPIGNNNGKAEYVVKGGRPPTPREIVKHLYPRHAWDKPGIFEIREIKPCGTIALLRKRKEDLPFNGQKVMMCLIASGKDPPSLNPSH